MIPREPEWIPVGAETAFSVGSFTLVDILGAEVGVIRTESGELRAVSNVCPHRLAPICMGQVGGTMLPSEHGTLRYGMEGAVLRCPWHGWEFNIETGSGLFGVTSSRLRTYEVRVEDGQTYVWSKSTTAR